MFRTKIAFLFGFVLIIIGCRKPINQAIPEKPAQFNDGFFVVCEGAYGFGNASISFINPFEKKTFNDVFKTVNGRDLGDQAQSMSVYNGKGYIMVQNSSKIEIVDIKDFRSIASLIPMSAPNIKVKTYSPRYFIGINGQKGYISDWTYNGLLVVDLDRNIVTGSIELDWIPEQMMVYKNKLFVACSGYSQISTHDNRIFVINTENDQVIDTIVVGTRPMQMVMDKNNQIWVLCKGYQNDNFGQSIDASFCMINPETNTMVKELKFNSNTDVFAAPGNLCINKNKDKLFYSYLGAIYGQSIDLEILNSDKMLIRNVYGLNIDPTYNYLIACIAPNFTSNGKVVRYAFTAGNSLVPLDSFEVGINPNGVCFLK